MSTLPISRRRAVIVAVLVGVGLTIALLPLAEGVAPDGRSFAGLFLVLVGAFIYHFRKAPRS